MVSGVSTPWAFESGKSASQGAGAKIKGVSVLDEKNAHAIRIAGPMDGRVFAFSAYFFGLGNEPPTSDRLPHREWPRYRQLLRPLRQAIYIDPLVSELQAAADERIDEETGQKFAESLKRHVDEGQALLDAHHAANEAAP